MEGRWETEEGEEEEGSRKVERVTFEGLLILLS